MTIGEDGIVERVPFMMALFFAHALRTIGEPSSYLYPLVSAFLLRRPVMDFKDVPMLYDLLYAAGQGSKRERRWMVRFIRDSVRSRSVSSACQGFGFLTLTDLLLRTGLANLQETSHFRPLGFHLPVLDRIQPSCSHRPGTSGYDSCS